MTLRRWSKQSKKTKVEAVYIPAFREACYRLIARNEVSASSEVVQAILSSSHEAHTSAVLNSFGVSDEGIKEVGWNDFMTLKLSQIGAQHSKQSEVKKEQRKIFSFKQMGEDWAKHISDLWGVISSDELAMSDKLVAYGALFYLVTPLDFIPDQIPFFGLMDDYGVLCLAASYYAVRIATMNGRKKLKPVR